MVMVPGCGAGHDTLMQVIEARSGGGRGSSLALALAVLLGVVLLGAGLAVGYMALTTSFISDVSGLGRDRVTRPLVGTLAWALAFLLPGLLVVFGLARLVGALDRAAGRRRRPRPVAAISRRLPDDYSVAQAVRLPDGRLLPEVVVGPQGLVVIEALPPMRASRITGRSWEVRLTNGRWLPIEHPLDRAARDAERLRHWISSEQESQALRVFAAVVSDGHELARTPEVAVVSRDQLASYLTSMPAARQMTRDRREEIIELLRTAI
jgi:hypothetical protein